MLFTITASAAMCWMSAALDIAVERNVTVADAGTPSHYDSHSADFDLFLSGDGTPNLSTGRTINPSSSAHQTIGTTAVPLCCTAVAVGKKHAYPVYHRHTLYYVYALHHMRN